MTLKYYCGYNLQRETKNASYALVYTKNKAKDSSYIT